MSYSKPLPRIPLRSAMQRRKVYNASKNRAVLSRSSRAGRYKGRSNMQLMPKYLSPTHPVSYIKHKYNEVLLANAVTPVGQPVVIAYGNTLYDPQQSATSWSTATGHTNNTQPLYRDTYAAMYDKYRVIGIKYVIRFVNGDVNPVKVVIYNDDNINADTSVETASQREGALSRLICNTNTTSGTYIVKGYHKPWKALGITRANYMNMNTTYASSGASPSLLSYINIIAQTLNNQNLNLYVDAQLTYYVQWLQPTEIAAS